MQTHDALRTRGFKGTIDYARTYKEDKGESQVMLSTYQGFVMRYKNGGLAMRHYSVNPGQRQLVILDEAHHAMAEGAQQVLRADYQNSAWLGFTATADYNEKRRLVSLLPDVLAELSDAYAASEELTAPFLSFILDLDVDMSSVPIVNKEYEARSVNRVMNNPAVNEAIARFYTEYFPGHRAIFNHSTVDHAEDMATMLRAIGVESRAIHGQLNGNERTAILEALKYGDLQALTQAKIIGEGYDDASISLAVNVSPTLSPLKEKQRSGRAMRIDPNNSDKVAFVVDCLGSHYRMEPATYSSSVTGGSVMGGWDVASHAQHAARADLFDRLGITIFDNSFWAVPRVGRLAVSTLGHEELSAVSDLAPLYDGGRSKARPLTKVIDFEAAQIKRSERGARRESRQPKTTEEPTEGRYSSSDLKVPSLPQGGSFRLRDDVSVLDYNETIFKPNPASEEEERILSWFLNGEGEIAFSNGRMRMVKRLMADLAGSEYLEDPDVVERFRTVQQRLMAGSRHIESRIQIPESLTQDRPSWYGRAACLGLAGKQHIFFPNRGESTRPAREVCNSCFVEDICLFTNLNNKFGIWGGMSERGRRRVRQMLKSTGVEDDFIGREILHQRGVIYDETQQSQLRSLISALRIAAQDSEDEEGEVIEEELVLSTVD